MALQITFTVYGTPKPGGSKRAFFNKHTGRAQVVDASGQPGKDWRTSVQAAAMAAYDGPLMQGPLDLFITFGMSRPKSHYGTGRNVAVLKPSAPKYPAKPPDTTKLIRALEDALTGIVWRDDAQVVVQTARKVYAAYGKRPGAVVTITEIDDDVQAMLAHAGAKEGQ